MSKLLDACDTLQRERDRFKSDWKQQVNDALKLERERDKYKHLRELDHSLADQWKAGHEKYAALQTERDADHSIIRLEALRQDSLDAQLRPPAQQQCAPPPGLRSPFQL